MIKKVTITGTESTGKTELAVKLADHYKTVHVPDYSRSYVEKLGRKYNHSDVLKIAKGIIEQERNLLHFSHRFLISDNDLINIKIWLKYYKWSVPDWLQEAIEKHRADLYLLCQPDIPWVADELRINSDDREELYNQFVAELSAISANYKIISGKDTRRLEAAIAFIDEWM